MSDLATEAVPGSGATDVQLTRSTVAVLRGGLSGERQVSLDSGATVLAALGAPTDEADRRGPRRVVDVVIEPEGRWCVGARPLGMARALEDLARVDLVFLALHGGDGEGGAIQGLLRVAGLRFTGSDVGASAVCLDKGHAREVVGARGVPLAPGRRIDLRSWRADAPRILDALSEWREQGWFVKPCRGGSSVGMRRAREPGELRAGIESVLAAGDDALVERMIRGKEVTCAVLGNRGEPLTALTPIEIRPHEGRYFDYEEKYSETGASEWCPPRTLGEEICRRARELATTAHAALGCDGYSRTDFLVPAEDERDLADVVFLETNTLPGLTPRSLVPLAAEHDGMDFRTLCLFICSRALAARGDPS